MVLDTMLDQYRKRKVALLVMGFHRSGTSALTRVMNLLGAGLPIDTLGPSPSNTKGHWEPLSILTLNEEILSALGSRWDDPRPLRLGPLSEPPMSRFVESAKAVIKEDFAGLDLIVIKEPRLCRLFPIYAAALSELGFSSRCIMPVRHPEEIAASLKSRNEKDESESEYIWVWQLMDAELLTRGTPRIWTTFSELMDDWRSTQVRIAAGLDISWPNEPESMAQEIDGFIEPSMRHFDKRLHQTGYKLGPVAARLWDAVEAGLRGDERTLRREFDAIRLVVEDIERLTIGRQPRPEPHAVSLASPA